MTEENFAKKLGVNAGSSVVGTGIGTLIGGPAGGLVGALITPLLTDVLSRLLSKKEKDRIEKVVSIAKEKLQKNQSKIKNDINENNYNNFFEGVLLKAKNSYEEKKIVLLANLFANIFFHDIKQENAIQLLELADRLTYRQLLVISAIGENHRSNFLSSATASFLLMNKKLNKDEFLIFVDIYWLMSMGLIIQFNKINNSLELIVGTGNIRPSDLILSSIGTNLYNELELSTLNDDEEYLEVLRILKTS